MENRSNKFWGLDYSNICLIKEYVCNPIYLIEDYGPYIGIRKYGKINRYLWKIRNFVLGKAYHKVIIRHKDFEPYIYCDPVEVMLFANFQILVDFVEKEKPFERIVTDDPENPESSAKRTEIRRLYNWWKNERVPIDKRENTKEEDLRIEELSVQMRQPLTEHERKILSDEYLSIVNKWDQEEQRNLESLISLREYLWT